MFGNDDTIMIVLRCCSSSGGGGWDTGKILLPSFGWMRSMIRFECRSSRSSFMLTKGI